MRRTPRLALLACCLAAVAAADPAAAPPTVAFLAGAEARAAVVDESIEPYFALLQTQEMASKTGAAIGGGTLAEQRAECRRRYQAAVREFTPAERAAITAVIASAQPLLASRYPLFAAEPWRFIKLDSAFEGGMPHTRGRCIVVSDAVMPMLTAKAAPNPAAVDLLVHEQTHVMQRLHPKPFAALYGQWGFERMPHEPERSPELIAHQLVNPDGVDCVWAFPVVHDGVRTLVEPQVIFGSDAAVPGMPRDFRVIALAVERHGADYAYVRDAAGRLAMTELMAEADYLRAFAPSQENFHPNEICAELFGRMVTLAVLGRPAHDSPCMVRLRAWAAAQLRAPPGG